MAGGGGASAGQPWLSRFCIARFFETFRETGCYFGDEIVDREFAVFTGVEVIPRVNRSGYHNSSGNGDYSGSGNGEGGNAGRDINDTAVLNR